MAVSLNVIALISGGKDSLYSILHCVQNGHRVVALANLAPPPERVQQEETGELDSMMYQTVGHQVIPLYAEALGLPLYRRVIRGTAVQTGQDYDTRDGTAQASADDEIEDLFALVLEVKKDHPAANALCSGAILSTYQRTRVESVALRLGLTPLAYLWQYPLLPPPQDGSEQDLRPDSLTGLLDDMAAAMCDARIIKTASAGIPERMLWSNVADPRARTQFVSRMARFYPDDEAGLRSAVLGEGGEYETLAICGPPAVWKKKIEIDPDQIKTVSESGGACYAILPPATLVPNDAVDAETTTEGDLVRRPGMFDAQFRRVLDAQLQALLPGLAGTAIKEPSALLKPLPHHSDGASILTHGTHIVLANETAPDAGEDAASQIDGIYTNLKHKLETQTGSDSSSPLTMSNAVFCLLLLSNMDDFAAVNAVYARMFPRGQPNPPARVTIAVDNLPTKAKVSLSVIVDARDRARRRALHVQSRSYWAPANIGPYSQAVNEALHTWQSRSWSRSRSAELVHLAGQIPLVPRTMQLLPPRQPFHYHAVLSLQHLWRVGQEREVDLWPWGVAFLASTNSSSGRCHEDAITRARVAEWVWKEAHRAAVSEQEQAEEEAEADQDIIDVWDRTFGKYAACIGGQSAGAGNGSGVRVPTAGTTGTRTGAGTGTGTGTGAGTGAGLGTGLGTGLSTNAGTGSPASAGRHLHPLPAPSFAVERVAEFVSSPQSPAITLVSSEKESTAAQQTQAQAETNHHNDNHHSCHYNHHRHRHRHPPPLLIANVATLPLGAPIEWWSTGLAHVATTENETENENEIITSSTETPYGAQHATILTTREEDDDYDNDNDDDDYGSVYPDERPADGSNNTNTTTTNHSSGPRIKRTIFTAIFISTNTITGPTSTSTSTCTCTSTNTNTCTNTCASTCSSTSTLLQDIIDSAIRSLEHATSTRRLTILDGTAFIALSTSVGTSTSTNSSSSTTTTTTTSSSTTSTGRCNIPPPPTAPTSNPVPGGVAYVPCRSLWGSMNSSSSSSSSSSVPLASSPSTALSSLSPLKAAFLLRLAETTSPSSPPT